MTLFFYLQMQSYPFVICYTSYNVSPNFGAVSEQWEI